MKRIVQYKSDDGSVWDDEDKAVDRDRLCSQVTEIMEPLGEPPRIGHGTYIEHNPDTVLDVRARFLSEVVRGKIIDKESSVWDTPLRDIHPMSYVGRVLDESCNVVSHAWHRFMCIDKMGREWDQPYFAIKADKNIENPV